MSSTRSGQVAGTSVVTKLLLLAWMFGILFLSWLLATLPGWSLIVAYLPIVGWCRELLLPFFYAPYGS